ncbi:1-acyl-sn-glycerol-3-phosphate acyltransferase [Candidatus Methylobacter favarea]|uniref:1-acyl-sn-glycerol-3-phosphate acyltransferase n=1 Tax=Candidatus Methylobacter favarea TaxID=2707345 RepID=A0A8S0WIJ8_9GAMM|nr:lysophospholipid acyltransferase family protein [Candidatus Methylobacter favarea]CAA9890594.1 1-acyl-sn-glycerol-3-phosphate acyltransferase [Candidatus Methylobacter favarea]
MKTRLRLIYKASLIIVLFLAGLIIAGIIFPIINAACSINKATDNCNQLKMHWLKCFSRILNLHIQIDGKVVDGDAILVSNHISWLDIIAIGQLLPACFVAKNDILNWPLIGYLAVQGGTVFIRRGDKRQVRTTAEKMVWLLKQHRKIIAFPEGTTSDGSHILPFHSSLFQPALLTKAAIQPIALEYLGDTKALAPFIGEDAFVPHLLRMLAMEELHISMKILPVIKTAGKKRHELAKHSRDSICLALYSVTTPPILKIAP